MRSGNVYIDDTLAGTITEELGNGYTFVYTDEYLSNPALPAISLTLPKTMKIYRSEVLFPFFANMLSEGSNRMLQSKLHHIDADDDFGILLATAYYDAPGPITVRR